MLSAWGIYHFHLSQGLDPDGFVERDRKKNLPILYAFVTDEALHAICIDQHGRWSDTRLMDSVCLNWPEEVDPFVLVGARASSVLTEDDIKKLRKASINTLHMLPDGRVLAPVGGGTTCSDMPFRVRMETDRAVNWLTDFEANLSKSAGKLFAVHLKHNGGPPASEHLNLRLIEGHVVGVFHESSLGLNMGSVPPHAAALRAIESGLYMQLIVSPGVIVNGHTIRPSDIKVTMHAEVTQQPPPQGSGGGVP